jgi:hypothetical protein
MNQRISGVRTVAQKKLLRVGVDPNMPRMPYL